ncbi:MAG: nicotinate-nucleotide adenylyltransferase [Kurthia sp.]|nr:nicotinate-nucleotide adenylyltransferase [Candidatus Kurthia equi]
MSKIGIFGGTFNPPHIGHLIMANEVLHALDLAEVRFMPNAIPPHKAQPNDATSAQRLHLTELAIEGNEHFMIEPYEIEQGGISYSYDTLAALTKREPEHDFYFIIGGDQVDSLHSWYRIEELLHFVTFVGVNRPGNKGITSLPITHVEAPLIDLSSTLIRQRLATNQTVTYLLPEQVERFIREEGLYGT